MAPNNADSKPSHPRMDGADETTPLLGASESGISNTGHANGHFSTDAETNGHTHKNTDQDKDPRPGTTQDGPSTTEADDKPMPYKQVLLLCYASLAEPVAYFSIFPFINEMIARNGDLPATEVGPWSGLIESLFSIVQMVLMIFYGRMSDRIGRKPVLVFSLTGIGLATALFGMGRSLWQMVVTRCLAGVFAGSVVTVRTMLSENTTKRTQGRAFSWYMFTRNLGIFIGPLVGGGLANPAEQFPSAFKGVTFFEDYPYALSTFTAGFIVLSSALTTLLFVDETLKTKIAAKSSAKDTSEPSKPPMSTWKVLTSPGVPMVLYILAHTLGLSLAYTAVSPVFMYTPVEESGFGFSDQQISYFLALAGASQAGWMLIAFPPLQKKLGTTRLMRWCVAAWPLFMALYPVLNEMLRHGLTTAFWIVAPLSLVIASGVSMSFACVQLFINDISPDTTVLGTVNALALTVNSGVRAVMPIAATSVFYAGIKWGWADGHLVWFILVAGGLGLIVACRFIPEGAEGKIEEEERREDEPRGQNSNTDRRQA